MADIAEEGGLGAVDLGQGLGASALLLVSLRVAYSRRDLSRHQRHEALVAFIEQAAWVDAGDQHTGTARLTRRSYRQRHRPHRRLVPVSAWQGAETRSQIRHDDGGIAG